MAGKTPHDFGHHFKEALKAKKPIVAGGPTADKVIDDHFDITPPDAAAHPLHAGDHQAKIKTSSDMHTHHAATKTAAADHKTHIETDTSALDEAGKATHDAAAATKKAAVEQAAGKTHNAIDLTHEALNQRAEAINEASLKAKEALKASGLEGDKLKEAEAAIERAAKEETAKLKAAGTAVENARKGVAEASGVKPKWDKGAASDIAKNVENNGKFLGSKTLGGVKSGIARNWGPEAGFGGKVQVVAGGIMMADSARRIIGDVSKMMGGEKGLDKEGNPLPSPGIMNLGFDVVEGGLGAVLASAKIFGKAR